MSKFKLGDRVRVTTSGKTGTVTAVHEANMWNMASDEYTVQFDDNAAIMLVEKVLELFEKVPEKKCICGLKYARSGGKHSNWCNIKNE